MSVGAFALADLPFGKISDWVDASAGGGISVEWAPTSDSPWAIVARAYGGVHFESVAEIDSFWFTGFLAGGRWLVPLAGNFSFAPEVAYGLQVNVLNGSPYADQAFQLSPLFRLTPSRIGYEAGPHVTVIVTADGTLLHAGFRAGARIGL